MTRNGNVTFVIPNQPPLLPVITATTSAGIADQNRQHLVLWDGYRLMKKAIVALQGMWITAADNVWFSKLCGDEIDYAQLLVCQLIEHIVDLYSKFEEVEHECITEYTKDEWDLVPSNNIYKQVNTGSKAFLKKSKTMSN